MCAVLALSGCGTRDGRTASDAPSVVSLNPCLDAILVEIAAPDQVLALSHYSRDPSASSIDQAQAMRFGVTGGTVEEVLALGPDIVLASSFIAPATKSALERLGVRVETFGSPTTLAESLDQVREVAAVVGRAAAGAALAQRIEDTPTPSPANIPALLWQSGEIVPGEKTLIAEQMHWAGFTSAAAERGLGQADRVSLEDVLANPPAVLLIAGNAAGQMHPALAEPMKAMHVAQFDEQLIYCGGPTIPKVRERLLEIRAEYDRRP
jgi:iron complex transport system substrate-binding protein